MNALDSLAGEVTVQVSDQHADAFLRGRVIVLVEQRLSRGVKYGAWVETIPELVDCVFSQPWVDLHFRPWLRPDRSSMPYMLLFPRATRILRWLHR